MSSYMWCIGHVSLVLVASKIVDIYYHINENATIGYS